MFKLFQNYNNFRHQLSQIMELPRVRVIGNNAFVNTNVSGMFRAGCSVEPLI